MDDAPSSHGSNKTLLAAIAVVLVVYLISGWAGVPQKGAEKVAQAAAQAAEDGQPHDADRESPQDAHGDPEHGDPEHGDPEHGDPEHGDPEHGEPAHAEAGEAAEASHGEHPPYWMVIPFVLLLGAIAMFPLIPATEHWWESNRNRFLVAAGLGILTLLYFLFLHEMPVAAHWPVHPDWPATHLMEHSESGPNWMVAWTVLANAILNEYVPFIMLLFSLYTISGGIRIQGDLKAHPLTNTTFIAVGGLLASFIGTTGAAMLLIRPLLETNSERRHVKHTVIFFIFVVCNCGGFLLPIGDPPLFLGYLRGVPFLWTFALWQQWLFVNVCLIGIYYLYDHFWYYPHEEAIDIARDETRVRGLKFSGLWPNAPLLLGVVLSVALLDPSQPLPHTDWHPWLYMREIVQLALVGLSLWWGNAEVRRKNNFNSPAIIEVAALFFGIFICMQPPLQILHVQGPMLGLSTPTHFFWLTGGLSAVLDNAPTYVVFFETAKTLGGENLVAGVAESLLVAVSLGAVFMGAMTYIGNGPNFMVKAIAEKSGIHMPSFFGYMLYSCVVLLPLLVVTTLIFL